VALRDEPVDDVRREPAGAELKQCDEASLPRRERGNAPSVGSGSHTEPEATLAAKFAPLRQDDVSGSPSVRISALRKRECVRP
jgi:hypothetical protein